VPFLYRLLFFVCGRKERKEKKEKKRKKKENRHADQLTKFVK
jgi:hypothetical protein